MQHHHHHKLSDPWDEQTITDAILEWFPEIGREKQRKLRERYYRLWKYMHHHE